MRNDKQIAIEMRKMGKSYRFIHSKTGIPVSTLSDWFSDEQWSKDIAQKLCAESAVQSTARLNQLNRVRGKALQIKYEEARAEARAELARLKYNPIFIAGVMLYWGEGKKDPRGSVAFSNSDPAMVNFYVQFLTRACGVPLARIRAHLILYPDHEEKVTRAYWARSASIPWENFTKSVVIQGREPMRRLSWGVCIVTVSSTYFKQKMLEWIKLLPKELIDKGYYENIKPFADIV